MNGLVIDARDGATLPAVNIFESTQTGEPLAGGGGTTTDANGLFDASRLKAPFVSFRYIGFRPLTIANRTGNVKIEMIPTAYDLPPVVIRPPVEPAPPVIKPKKNNWVWLLGLFAAYKILK